MPESASTSHEMTCGNVRYNPTGIQQNVDGWVRRIEFEPGYDCIRDYPSCWNTQGGGRHGRGGMRVRFLLGAEEGFVQFLMAASDWMPGSVDEMGCTRDDGVKMFGAQACDLGHHWTRPVYESETSDNGPCEYLHGAPCFYDGSGLNAGPVMARFFREGLDGVWQELEEYHRYCSEAAAKVAAG